MTSRFDFFSSYSLPEDRAGLTIFMPYVHPARTRGMAESFGARGHKLMVSGPDSVFRFPGEAAVSPEEAMSLFGPNVSAYCGSEIFDNPPDVIIVGTTDHEALSFDLHTRLGLIKPVTIMGMSGNFHTLFDFSRYDGVICCDVATRVLARCNRVPAIRYVEATWLDDYPATPMPGGHTFSLRSFINDLGRRYPNASDFQQECCRLIASRYGSEVVAENCEWLPRDEARQRMIDTSMIAHFKDQEGYGWAVIESLFLGRPIIYQEGLSKDMTFVSWLETGVSGFPIREPSDILSIIDQFKDDPDRLAEIHKRTAEIVRERYDGRESAEDMVRFVVDLHRIARARWIPNQKKVPAELGGYFANLNPAKVQDFERVLNDAQS